MFCPTCNRPNRDDAKFCKQCGQHLADGEVVTPSSSETGAGQLQGNSVTSDWPNDVEDPNLAPTQILTPQQMVAYHARRWQQETPRKRIDDTEAIVAVPFVADEPAPIPPPPPGTIANTTDQDDMKDTETTEQTVSIQAIGALEAKDSVSSVLKEEDSMTQESSDQSNPISQPDQSAPMAPTIDFPMLAVGTTVIGRYEVTQVVSENAPEHVYQVADHQGYQHCWNCGSEQNREGDEFCIDCGAALLNVSYIMHEYVGTEISNTDNSAEPLPGTVINTFVDQSRTYLIEHIPVVQNAFPTGVHLLVACDSDAGYVRRTDPNEDSVFAMLFQRVHESIAIPVGVGIVADGLGGHDNGQAASRMTIGIIAERLVHELLAGPLAAEKSGEAALLPGEDDLVALVQSAVEGANASLCLVNQRDKTDMGSTLTGYLLIGDYAYIMNVGDSRTYMLRGGQLYQLTTDHSLVGQLVASGLIQPDDVYTHPQRSQIFRSLGDKPNVQVDMFKQQLHPGDVLVSCSDGLWEMVRNPQIESIVNNAPHPQVACTQLIEAANANGGEDNISAVVVFVQ